MKATGELRQTIGISMLTLAGAGGVGSRVRPIGRMARAVKKMVMSGGRLPSAGICPNSQAPVPSPIT
ncbi:hypothetical protein D3C72_1879420 [compost metagenome]